jgi:signal transduction histidine kinase
LGLALVFRIARAHDGRLTFENRPEGGARVTLEVPR